MFGNFIITIVCLLQQCVCFGIVVNLLITTTNLLALTMHQLVFAVGNLSVLITAYPFPITGYGAEYVSPY
jgi:hypothetical protein